MRRAMVQDHVKYARAKGLATRRIILVYVEKNKMIPVVTVIGREFGRLIGFFSGDRDNRCMDWHGSNAD